MHEKIRQLLLELRLNGMEQALQRELQRADKNGSAITQVLLRLLTEEKSYRQQRSTVYRLSQAKLPWEWTLKSFPFEKQPGVNKTHIMGLADLSFVQRAENIVFIGDPGTGKTGIHRRSRHRQDRPCHRPASPGYDRRIQGPFLQRPGSAR
jgi:DNA replication protein DnaC